MAHAPSSTDAGGAAADTNLSAAKAVFPGLERERVEERTDLYFPYSAAVGIKARGIGLERPGGDDTVEVKVRHSFTSEMAKDG